MVGFFKYFFKYIFFNKTRQRLLLLAAVGLFLSSFSLIILQSTMGGLQDKLMNRAYGVEGSAEIQLRKTDLEFSKKLINEIQKEFNVKVLRELQLELLLRSGDTIMPAIIHGVDYSLGVPKFLEYKDHTGLALGIDLFAKLGINGGKRIQMIAPSHTDSFLGEVPRSVSTEISDILETYVGDIDQFHGWVRASLLHNLIRSRHYNQLKVYGDFNTKRLEDYLAQFGEDVLFIPWQKSHASLVWALNLESIVMTFLFIGMSLLVAVSITSGFSLFFDKIRMDLVSFWILGYDLRSIQKNSLIFIYGLSFIIIASGLLFGIACLLFYEKFGFEVMPDIFVDRKIPILISPLGIFVSVLVPYSICFVFSSLAFATFQKEKGSFINAIRSIG